MTRTIGSLFVFEAVCGGGWNGDLPPSLLAEGRAMLDAVLDDLSELGHFEVHTTFDHRLQPLERDHVQTHPFEEFDSLVNHCDAVLVIAPETDGELERYARRIPTEKWLGCDPETIALFTDKVRFAEEVRKFTPYVLPTLDPLTEPETFPVVIKPRDGAGSQETRAIHTVEEYHAERQRRPEGSWMMQPCLPGRPLSIAGLFGDRSVEPLAIVEQRLSHDGTFQYRGGCVNPPLRDAQPIRSYAEELLRDFAIRFPGLRGYVGFDLLLMSEPAWVMLVEVNPRLTTSYLGYRRLYGPELAHGLVDPERWTPHWSTNATIDFTPRSCGRE